MSIRSRITNLKNNQPFFLLLWHFYLYIKGLILIRILNDKKAIIKLYSNYSGHIPNLTNPITFSEKLQILKLNYKNPLTTKCADKNAVREYLIEKGYKSLLNNKLSYYTKVSEIDFKKLPKKFVLKATHASGWNLIVKDKSEVNWLLWKLIFWFWLKDNIFWQGREWPYKNMTKGIICEEYIEDYTGSLMDYKFFCFSGKAKFIQVNKGRDSKSHVQNFYDLNWNQLPFGKDLNPRFDVQISPPVNLKKMITIAEDLSFEFPFVRVDFYEVNTRIIFGEMTFYPKSGLPDFKPIEYDKIFGKQITTLC